jgi:hypothetical protein
MLSERLGRSFGAADSESEAELLSLRQAIDRLREHDEGFVLTEPGGPILFEDPWLDVAWSLTQPSTARFAPAAEGDDLTKRMDHWIPLIVPLIKGRFARTWDVLREKKPTGVINLTAPARLAIFGDGGYRGLAQRQVFDEIEQAHRKSPFHAILHLGDTYRGGDEAEMFKHLAVPLSDLGRRLDVRVFSLCGNHDVYAGPEGYLGVLKLLGQPGRYFAIETPAWCVACLDTTLADSSLLRHNGRIDREQVEWLRGRQNDGKPLVILTHHSPRSAWNEGAPELRQMATSIRPFVWYWGHEHRAVAFGRRRGADFYGGCVGNGAFLERWGEPPHKDEKDEEVIDWYPRGRCTCYGESGPHYWPHGFLELELTQDSVSETWHVEGEKTFTRSLRSFKKP